MLALGVLVALWAGLALLAYGCCKAATFGDEWVHRDGR